ncbi:hypothetical protein [Paraglaciecola hydrolytica]|uniref:Uncharacterized protein n=1 Tax=Paraglaciecola hydrolytica TaxID=1799789 RepID=A0A148KMY8_9ALTE|nr:hypothetical protein [Paraglaciecola hydrolytica]KXI27684.1 hypothetical protein AX660_19215 [Paraglaciecola hydrolytica]
MDENAVNQLINEEMKQIAVAKAIKKKLFNDIHVLQKSDIFSKYYNSKGKGKKENMQIEWKHFIVEEHEKDKTSRTIVNQRKGTTRNGNSYVKDVNVKTIVTQYDYIKVKNDKNEVFNYRLVDLNMAKLSVGQIVSLGWIYHKQGENQPDSVIEQGASFGQMWQDDVQPMVCVHHSDGEKSHELTYQGMSARDLFDHVHSNSIGLWHLLWILPIILMFNINWKNDNEALMVLWLVGGGIVSAITMAIKRHRNGDKMFKTFLAWYDTSAKHAFKVGSEALLILQEQFSSSRVKG